MRPTEEQIVAMEKRGWDYDPRGSAFVARGCAESPAILLRVWLWSSRLTSSGWIADYGWSGDTSRVFGPAHPDPIAAAAECEAWLRGVLSGFRFPWLRVEG